MAGPRASGYRRHRPEDTVLYGVVEQHAERFFEEQGEQGGALPGFVREEFGRVFALWSIGTRLPSRQVHAVSIRALGGVFGNCSCIALPPASMRSSCKRRGWCPSCASRRMAEAGAHLVDNMLPHTPYRQWVLSFPWPLRLAVRGTAPMADPSAGCGHTGAVGCAAQARRRTPLRGGAHRHGDVYLTAMDGGNA